MEDYRLRVRIFTSVILVVLAILGGRLMFMQLLDTEGYTDESRNNAIRERLVRPSRGAIFDRRNRLMVDNRPVYSIQITPRYFPRAEGGGRYDFDPGKVQLLARLLAVSDSTVWAKLDAAVRRNPDAPTDSFEEVPFESFGRVQEHLYQLPGVTYDIKQTRRYHTDAKASHALGYIREIDKDKLAIRYDDGYRRGDMLGITGVENKYEMYLRGKLGRSWELVNARGLNIGKYEDGRDDSAPLSGFDLHLSIDSRVQALAESLFVNKRGGAVALDPNTGEILALVSAPDYDLSMFTGRLTQATVDYVYRNPVKPLYNRATQSQQVPGSTWKPFMALMALNEGVITKDETVTCSGGHPLGGGRFFRCMHVHGRIASEEAIQRSCNTYFFEMMNRIAGSSPRNEERVAEGVDTFARYAHYFGMGTRITSDVQDQSPGLIPDSTYFADKFGDYWNLSWMNLGIGQGDLGNTPLELALYTSAVANGGLRYSPHLIKEMRHPETGETVRPSLPAPFEIPIAAEHFETVRNGMRLVMEAGTGRGVQIPGVTSGGKTGTAQDGRGRKDNSVFIMFAPYDNPQIAVAVQVENAGYGSTAAAPIASLMAEQYLNGGIAPERRALAERVRAVRSQEIID